MEFPISSANFLTRGPSDHSPMIVTVSESKSKGKPFKFFDFWVENDEFISTVEKVWNKDVVGSPMYRVCKKLKNLKPALKDMNKEKYSDISCRVGAVRQELQEVQMEVDRNPRNRMLQSREKELCKLYTDLVKAEESLARQKARIQWLELGDKNSSFFFKCINNNRNRGRIHNIVLPNGEKSDSMEDTCEAFVNHFKNVLRSPHVNAYNGRRRLGELVKVKVNENQMRDLGEKVSEEEIREVFWSLKRNKAPGPDGYSFT